MDAKNHGTEDEIERYTRGALPEAEIAALEEHLLICDGCRDRADSAEAFNTAMREALKQDAQAPQSAPADTAWMAWLRRPAFQMALAVIVLLAALAIYSGKGNGLPPLATLRLTATRGEMPSVKPALELDLSLTGIPADGGPFRVELVNAQGQNMWGGLADSEGDAVFVKVSARLQPGDYFARLYSDNGPMLHEYGFRVAN